MYLHYGVFSVMLASQTFNQLSSILNPGYNFQRVGRKLGDSHIDNNKTRAIFFLLLVTVQQCCCV